MEHLTTEILARLVDEPPREEETRHLSECQVCTSELDALRAQTQALGSLPEVRPPLGDWEFLEARLRSEGLVRDPSLFHRLTMGRTPGWMRAAAAAALFLGGGMFGAAFTGDAVRDVPSGTSNGAARMAAVDNLDDAASAVRNAEADYMYALARYRELLGEESGQGEIGDPITNLAALEYLVAAGQAAVRQAPADPFLNGLLASTLAEREAVLRRISTRQDNWF
ncbi:MAG: hypothetical protein P8170_02260 [Gemmatimonadota bacterium]|jgi:hypothetical protein